MRPVALLVLAAASATAVQAAEVPDDHGISMEVEGSATPVSTIYEVDEDRDGRTDRLLILEQSDSLA